jgi:hypothetical protein
MPGPTRHTTHYSDLSAERSAVGHRYSDSAHPARRHPVRKNQGSRNALSGAVTPTDELSAATRTRTGAERDPIADP